MSTRGIRGANVVEANTSEEILSATKKLLEGVCEKNPSLQPGDIASIIFTVTDDLNAVHPALAARLMGWVEVPMLCGQEIPVPGSMPRCIRILIQWNTDLAQNQIQHVYLGAAAALRPDLTAPIQNLQK
jgi:chorismate mutase